ncbi:hypothetical protein BGZ99_001312 [Dissophora globulifera]|uniref:SH3 domain-containing protein n=1 Tax=Dissophora globulifera TaxID=979702 RepID=A0A9P6RTL3_9FUNG|nr:hypothetical protein BGZ99_001312 [Dissophora globulifera]
MVRPTHAKAKALFDCVGDEESELTFREGDLLIDVRETSEEGWLHGKLERTGEEGLFPDNYVELLQVEATPVTKTIPESSPLPAKSTIGDTSSFTPATTHRSETASTQPSNNNSTAPKPVLPARNAGLRTVGVTGPSASNSFAPSKVVVPGLGSRSVYGSVTPAKGFSEPGRAMSGPPALPKRGNIVPEKDATSTEQDDGPTLSVRERMANLSMASQRPLNPSSTLTAASPPASLSPKPTPKEVGGQKGNDIRTRSPLSSASRPALPPRNLAETSDDPALGGSSSSTTSTTTKHVYQVQDAAVPVPKLTTFSRPRSARSAKQTPVTSPTSTSPEPVVSMPPKLPSRTPSVASLVSTPATKPVDSPGSNSGPVRFSPALPRQTLGEMGALPTISRNNQPLALPSRTNLGAPTPSSVTTAASQSLGLGRPAVAGGLKATATAGRGIQEKNDNDASATADGPGGAVFGVKLNPLGPKTTNDTRPLSAQSAPSIAVSATDPAKIAAPPLPARSNTIPLATAASEGPMAPAMKLQRDMNAVRQFSPSLSPSIIKANRDQQMAAADLQSTPQYGFSIEGTRSWAPISASSKARLGSRVAIAPSRIPDVAAQEAMGVKADARRRYEALFRTVSTGDYIEGAKVHAIYVRSRLDSKTLAQIWDLVDVDCAGRLSKAQFCMGLYLIDERLASGLIPLEVSDELWVSVMQ